jgi:shikimate kinase / 3-dehydroquinate synthase
VKHLILNGFMATGKSTIGPIVASQLGLRFVDLDEEIERRSGKGVGEIFRDDGEARFRAMESEALESTLARPPHVVAGGGGLLQDNGNRAVSEAAALVVTLTCPTPELARRAANDGERLRPVLFRALSAGGGSGPDAIVDLLKERSWLYDAYPSVPTDGGSPEDAARKVVATYHRYREGQSGAAYELPFPGLTTTEIIFSPLRTAGDIAWLVLDGAAAPGLVCDKTIFELAGDRISNLLGAAGSEPAIIVIPPGEETKSLEMTETLLGRFQAASLERSSTVVALGGGVVGDLAGFAAATYMRGLRLVNVPTTLLAQVDASIGGKTGVDFGGVKNLVGSFYPAHRVVVDQGLLHSLPVSRLREGLAEMIKIAIVRDPGLLEQLESLTSPEQVVDRPDLVRRAIRNKVEVVKADPFEQTGRRALLNFGHTIGHAVESAGGYSRPHGECVAIGMMAEARIALSLGAVQPEVVSRLEEMLRRLGLPAELPDHGTRDLLDTIRQDKKRAGGKIRMVILKAVGEADLEPVSEDDILASLGKRVGV